MTFYDFFILQGFCYFNIISNTCKGHALKMLTKQINLKFARLKNTMSQTVALLTDINKNISEYNRRNEKMVQLATVYKKWKEKIEASENNVNSQ